MIDNLTCLIMSKKIVLSVLLSLLFGILGAKASVGGFPTYPSLGGLPYKCTAVKDGDGAWQWRTTVDDRIAFKINGTRLELGWLSVFGDAKRLVIQFGMGTLSDKALACIELPKDIGRQTLQKAKIVFSKGKEAQTMVAIDGLRTISRSFNFYPDTNGEDVLLTMLKSYDVKKIIIGSNVVECQTSTKATFGAMLYEWHEKFFGNDFKPEYSGK